MTDINKNLRTLPGVDHLLALAKLEPRFSSIPRSVVLDSLRQVLDRMRKDILAGTHPVITDELFLEQALSLAEEKIKPRLVSVINATGVVLHTNLGRALLCDDALSHITAVAKTYSNLELNLGTGKRGIRYEAVDGLLCELTGAESAIVVNNNAGAVLLALNTLARQKEVVVSRGELVEIGGSFRVPDVMEKSGCVLKEVGTTNRTHLRDYETAVGENTALFLKVHTSNYKIEGFTANVALKDLVVLGQKNGIPVMEDLGSGTLVDFSKYGLPREPTVGDAVRSGAHVVTFSGDKLLGGPQAGIIVGKKESIDQIRKNPLTRALRIDKLTLAALESTLRLYRDEEKAIQDIPTLRMLTLSFEDIVKKADLLFQAIQKAIGPLAHLRFSDMNSRPGGGSFPELDLPTRCVTIQPVNLSVSKLETAMRLSTPAIIGRIEDNRYILDPRTLQDGQEAIIASTLARILEEK
jgi:L-seryl-tRNA(Ser) seleniumtransferase